MDDILNDYTLQLNKQEAGRALAEINALSPPDKFAAKEFIPEEVAEVPKEERSLGQKAIATGIDITKGVTEQPRSAIRGLVKASDEIWSMTPFFESGEVEQGMKDLGLMPAEPTSNTGKISQNIYQFLVGLAPAAKATKALGIASKAPKITGAIINPAIAETISFDEQEERLSNIISDISGGDESLVGKTMSYIKSEEDDTVFEGKIKQAAEGVLTNAAGEALLKGVKYLKNFKKAETSSNVIKPVDLDAQVASRMSTIGDVNDPNLIMKKLLQSEKEVGLPPSNGEVKINFARISGEDDVKNAMQQYADMRSKEISKAARGKISNVQTLKNAQDVNGFETLLSRRTGEALNAEQITSARMFYYDTTDSLLEASYQAAERPDDIVSQYNFRKMLAVHNAVQKEILGARTEAGRALQAWSIELGGRGQGLKDIEELVNSYGGVEASSDLAQRIASLGKDITTDKINTISQQGWGARSSNALIDCWTMGLLTNPTTHSKNILSGLLTNASSAVERAVSAGISDNVSTQEAYSFAYGMLTSMREALTNAKDAFKLGSNNIARKAESSQVLSTSREVLDPKGELGWLSKGIEAFGSGLRALTSKMLAAGDTFNYTLAFNAEKRALLTRKGLEQGLKGNELQKFIETSINIADDSIDNQAREFGLLNTFNNNLSGFGKDVANFVRKNKALRFFVPFVRTPINVFNYTMKGTPLAPLYKSFRDDISAGGTRAARAKARVAMGSSIMMVTSDLANGGYITGSGPTNKNQREALMRQGWKPYSIKVGDNYVSYQGLEPISSWMSLASDFAEISQSYSMYDIEQTKELEDTASAIVASIFQNVTNKSYLTGFSDIISVINDPARYSEEWFKKFSASFVPAIVGGATRMIDPTIKYTDDMMSSMRAKIYGANKGLETKLNLWGDELRYRPNYESKIGTAISGVASLFNPFYYSAVEDSPIDKEILDIDAPVTMPSWKQSFKLNRKSSGIAVDLKEMPDVYWDFVRLSGNELKLEDFGNKGCRDYLNDLVSNKDSNSYIYKNMDAESKGKMIKNIIDTYREASKIKIYNENEKLRRNVNQNMQLLQNEQTIRMLGVEQ